MWDSEPSQQWENFFGIIVLQFVCHPPGSLRFDFIMIVPLLPFSCIFFFVFGRGVSFCDRFNVLLSMFVQQLFVILVLSQEMITHLSTTTY